MYDISRLATAPRSSRGEGSPPEQAPDRKAKQTVDWFWAHVEGLAAEDRAELLEWITGYHRLPAGGFPPPVRQ
eukprot:CAMPEP_0179207160 /NCGR_PEP_ID=MMETSP0796-20121207/103297_1 /TAXON_ID=73915 /ORGANISM="Pyrodinium bahamense, Strain pbaha01" /LENGTH=72 /DNA_ID=CAMNT_0020912083 /DNA_START=60 /DNA_END=275 /DNA_ORIENTATION=+